MVSEVGQESGKVVCRIVIYIVKEGGSEMEKNYRFWRLEMEYLNRTGNGKK